jgi:hypothetical protein
LQPGTLALLGSGAGKIYKNPPSACKMFDQIKAKVAALSQSTNAPSTSAPAPVVQVTWQIKIWVCHELLHRW